MVCNFNEDNNICLIETNYDKYESDIISKSICMCNRLCKENKFVDCTFYNRNNQEIYKCCLPNDDIYYNCYVAKEGISITNLNSIVLRNYKKPGITCYSIATGEIIWEYELKNIGQVFVFNDKIYYEWVNKHKIELGILSATNGEFLGYVLKFVPKRVETDRPFFGRLNNDFIIVYIIGYLYIYDIANNELLLSPYKFEEEDIVSRIITIKQIFDNKVQFNFRDFIICDDKGVVEYREEILCIKDILHNIEKSTSQSKILTNKESLEKEYAALFGSKK